jgi:hypothetical protein
MGKDTVRSSGVQMHETELRWGHLVASEWGFSDFRVEAALYLSASSTLPSPDYQSLYENQRKPEFLPLNSRGDHRLREILTPRFVAIREVSFDTPIC